MDRQPDHRVAVRFVLGLAQGLLLYWLYHAARTQGWPATVLIVFVPLLLIVSFVPLLLLFGIGNLRPRTLLLWGGTATALLLGLAVHSVERAVVQSDLPISAVLGIPTLALFIAAGAGLFVGYALIAAGDTDRSFIADYPRYFDAAWKLELQIMLAALFVGLFWILLFLGVGLLGLVKIQFLDRLIHHAWFSIPVTAMAFSAAIHLTDVRPGIIAGVRALIHIVLSWLLPTIAIIAGIFLAGLPAVGLDLGHRVSEGGLLLVVAAVLTVLINAVYRDGTADQAAPRVLRIAATVAAVELVPIVAIAGYAIGLRVGEHGWTVARVLASAAAVVLAWHAVGYAIAVARRGPWMKRLERCNVLGAFLALATLIALLTPLADPSRIAVANQVSRLKSGQVSPEGFDYSYLHDQGASYGKQALEALVAGAGDNNKIAENAQRALDGARPLLAATHPPTAEDLATTIAVYPAGRTLPETFLRQKWRRKPNSGEVPRCLFDTTAHCSAMVADLDGDGADEVILFSDDAGLVFKSDSNGKWDVAGRLALNFNCPGVMDAVRNGQFILAPSAWKELTIAGKSFRIGPPLPNSPNCP